MNSQITILLVDDHADTLFVVERGLTRSGFNVITAIDVEHAIAVGSSNEFSILISDIGLPDGNGWDVLQRLREIKSFPAIAVTGYGFVAEMNQSLETRFDECMLKPYSMEALMAAIVSLCNPKAKIAA